jgi:capsular exopolysaccharide synthesis family protein
MSKIFEALQKAEKEQAGPAPETTEEAPKDKGIDLPELESLVHFSTAAIEPKPSAGKISPWLVVHWQPESPIVEQIKRVRTHIQHYTQGPTPPRALMVTSAVSGEGKSLLSANLAVSIAQGLGDSVLLVDGDIRNPTLHHYFSQPQSPGLSDYLAGEAELEGIVRATPVPRLSFIAAGGKKKNPIELISSDRMARLVEEIRDVDKERFVLFDTTPVMVTNEPRILAKMMDGVVLVVRQDVTPRNAVKEAISVLTKEKIIGVIFNDTQLDSLGLYGYRYKGYYGYDGLKKDKKGKKAKRR